MILGLGIDLLEVSRMEQVLARTGQRFLDRIFTAEEQQHCRQAGGGPERWAVRFAAKEAVLKALGTGWTGGISWHQVEILRTEAGAPEVRLQGRAREVMLGLGGRTCHLSMTHQRDQTAAVAILEGHSA